MSRLRTGAYPRLHADNAATSSAGEWRNCSNAKAWTTASSAVRPSTSTSAARSHEHDDVDFAVWLHDVEAVVSLLETHAWRHNPYPDEDGGTGYERDGVRVELTYLVSDDTGRVFIPLRERNALWSERAPGSESRSCTASELA